MLPVRGKESEHLDEEALDSHDFYYRSSLEDGINCEPCRSHVFRNLAKTDSSVEAFPQFYTHVFSACVIASNTFSEVWKIAF